MTSGEKMKNGIQNADGFTLIELLVAMTLLTIGILSIISMQVTAIKSNSIANMSIGVEN